jgi:hypothetical protein
VKDENAQKGLHPFREPYPPPPLPISSYRLDGTEQSSFNLHLEKKY